MSEQERRPVLRVVRGEPTEVEVAALVAALAGLSTESSPQPPPRSRWSDRASQLRQPLPHGQDAWRASARLR
ncbi:acyl-CoA carboxylase epsilon subunit [Actinophytocola sediminis]